MPFKYPFYFLFSSWLLKCVDLVGLMFYRVFVWCAFLSEISSETFTSYNCLFSFSDCNTDKLEEIIQNRILKFRKYDVVGNTFINLAWLTAKQPTNYYQYILFPGMYYAGHGYRDLCQDKMNRENVVSIDGEGFRLADMFLSNPLIFNQIYD